MAITTELKVFRYNWIKPYPNDRGYVQDWGSYQLLVKVWKWHGIQVWSRVIDREDIPEHVIISLGTLGYAEWTSRFAEHIK